MSSSDSIYRRLYCPPPAGTPRQVVTMSRGMAEQLPVLDDVGIVSITSPDRGGAALAGFEFVLRLEFADVDFLAPELTGRAAAKLEQRFRPQHAESILAFLDTLPDKIRTVVIHCEGGYSRSCAVALALGQMRGYMVTPDELRGANPSVWSLLTGRPREQFGRAAGLSSQKNPAHK